MTTASNSAHPAISVRGVSKRFGETEVLHGIDLEIPHGQVTCVIGPSGSGKSTLLRCMAFLEEATEGTILINGEPLGFSQVPGAARVRLAPERIRAVRANIGMCFQQFNLWPHMTALGNVSEALKTARGVPKAQAEERAMAQLRKVGLEDRAGHYPSQLSGGQQQRVAIARALACELKVMRDLAADGMTMVVVSHEIGFAASVANRITFLDEGKLLLHGTPAEVFGKPRHPRLDQFLDTYLDRGAAMLV